MSTFTLIGKVEGFFNGALHTIGTPTLRNINKDSFSPLSKTVIGCKSTVVFYLTEIHMYTNSNWFLPRPDSAALTLNVSMVK